MLRTLDEIRALKDPLKKSQIEFYLQENPALLLSKLTQKAAGLLSGNTTVATSKELRLRCTSYSLPSSKIKTHELILFGHKRTRPTWQDRSGTWKLKITEDFNGSVHNILQAWLDIISNPLLGNRTPQNAFVTTVKVVIGGSDEGGNVSTKLDNKILWLRGVYPISLKLPDIDPSSSDAVEIEVEFNYDYYADNSYSLWSFTN